MSSNISYLIKMKPYHNKSDVSDNDFCHKNYHNKLKLICSCHLYLITKLNECIELHYIKYKKKNAASYFLIWVKKLINCVTSFPLDQKRLALTFASICCI